MDGEVGKNFLTDYLKKTGPIFERYLVQKISEVKEIGELPSALLSSLSKITRKGKKIRGSLVVLGYKAAGGTDEKAILDASLSIELIHAGLLVHDDIQDRDDIRRGLPTIHKEFSDLGQKARLGKESAHYGLAMGINAGISAYFLGYDKLLESNFPEERLTKAARITADYILRVSHGQALDVANVLINNINQEELLNILKYKTAEYTGVLPLLIGASLAGKSDRLYLKALKEYGLSLGWAFQIQDDILGAFGNEETLGKPVGSDFREGKVTLLMLHLAKHGTPEQKRTQQQILGNKKISKEEISLMQQTLRDCGSLEYVKNLGWDYVKKGEKLIPSITKEAELQNIFRSLLYFMMERAV